MPKFKRTNQNSLVSKISQSNIMQITSTLLLMKVRKNIGRSMNQEMLWLKTAYGQWKVYFSADQKCQRRRKLFMANFLQNEVHEGNVILLVTVN